MRMPYVARKTPNRQRTMPAVYAMPTVYVLGLSVLISGCNSTNLAKLANGQYSNLDSADNSLRMSLAIDRPVSSPKLSYPSAALCWYHENQGQASGSSSEGRVKVSMQPVGNNIFVTLDGKDGLSSALVDHSGKLIDFNFQNPAAPDLGRYNPGVSKQLNKKMLDQFHAQSSLKGNNTHAISNFFLPEYVHPPREPGDTVAYARSEDGAVWASYTYRGVANYNGTSAAILDLQRNVPGLPDYGPILMGFSIVDAQTAMPILKVFRTGNPGQYTQSRLEQISCSFSGRPPA
jgi:hypothetical protein